MPGASPTSTVDPSEQAPSGLDAVLAGAFADARTQLTTADATAVVLVDEIERLVRSGGKRLRPAFCVLGFRAAGGDAADERIVHAAAALELLHTMAIIHDDLMDESSERRGVASSHRHLEGWAARAGVGDPERVGRSLAVLAGDLSAVLADRLFLRSGFPPDSVVDALDLYATMRIGMAAGQALDVVGAVDVGDRRLVAAMRGGSYTVAAPLLIGATLGAAPPDVRQGLAAYGEPLGEAFQLLDDLRDGDRGPVDRAGVVTLIERAKGALDPEVLGRDVVASLERLADRVSAG